MHKIIKWILFTVILSMIPLIIDMLVGFIFSNYISTIRICSDLFFVDIMVLVDAARIVFWVYRTETNIDLLEELQFIIIALIVIETALYCASHFDLGIIEDEHILLISFFMTIISLAIGCMSQFLKEKQIYV